MSASSAIQPTLWHRAKRWLYIVHRWLGIASCLLFAMWFVSGLVMIYVPFPSLTRNERLAGLPAIDWSQVHLPPGSALRAAALSSPPRAFFLEMRADRPVWRIQPTDGPEIDISAATGQRLTSVDWAEASRAASLFAHRPVVAVARIERDQWTVAGGFDRHRPLWKASLAGPGGLILYVSSTTGAVVLDTDSNERFWNWLGSVPHWIYPTVLRQDNGIWRQVVMWVSGPCIVVAVTGFWIGILRTRVGRRRFKHGRMSPYHGWFGWHHWAGLIGGLFLIGWIFSGWLSVDPFRLFAGGAIESAAQARYEGATAPVPVPMRQLAAVGQGAKQVEVRWLFGRMILIVSDGGGDRRVLDASTLKAFSPTLGSLKAGAARLMPGVHVANVALLSLPDTYWYEVGTVPALPIMRVRFDDAARTWVHIDLATGQILGTIDARGRLYRWLFDLLHKWDLNVLTLHRPAWDGLLWLLSLAGLVTSISGIRIAWARLTRGPRQPSIE